MGQKQRRSPGLQLRNGVWIIDKQVRGGRICESTGSSDLTEAETYLAFRVDAVRKVELYGVRPLRTFREAATRYLTEFEGKRAIGRDAQDLKLVDPWIGQLGIHQVHMSSLMPFIEARRQEGVAAGTINRTLSVVRQILNLCAKLWRDEKGLTWCETAPLIQLLDDRGKRKPYPLSWAEQDLLFGELPNHLRQMATFAVNTGCRESEATHLEWSWEVPLPELNTSVFIIPDWLAKNGKERVLVLNRAAQAVVEQERGKHPERVFTLNGAPLTKIYNSAWKRARLAAAGRYPDAIGKPCPFGYANIRVHDLRHTFGRRLRSLAVSLEDRQDLLGHESGRMTTHYSAAEIKNLLDAVNLLCSDDSRKNHAVTFLRIADRR